MRLKILGIKDSIYKGKTKQTKKNPPPQIRLLNSAQQSTYLVSIARISTLVEQ